MSDRSTLLTTTRYTLVAHVRAGNELDAYATFARLVYIAHATEGCEAQGVRLGDLPRLGDVVVRTADTLATVTRERDEARAALPRWVREDDHTWTLMLGSIQIGGVMGPHPEHGAWGAMATGDDDVTEHPTMDDAARAVCKSIGIPYVAIPQPADTALAGAKL